MIIGKRKITLWQQVLVALFIGIIVGIALGPKASSLKYLGLIFLNLIKMVTVPMIFFTIIYGITSIEGSSDLYRISYKAIGTFIFTSSLAVMIGLFITSIIYHMVYTYIYATFHVLGTYII